jgi:uncharacterized protein YrrD
MKLTKGSDVFTSTGEKLGTLRRVIIDPQTMEVTHVVVEKGFLFTTDRVVPVDQLHAQDDERIALADAQQDFDQFPVFEESHYVTLDENDRPVSEAEGAYWYPPVDLAWWRTGATYMGYYPPIPNYVLRTNQNIPEGTIALEEGARVISKDGNHVGNVDQVIVDPEDNRATHFVVNEGLLFTNKKLIPVTWISSINEDDVKLSVASGTLERLPEHKVQAR